jgi:isomerase DpgB
MTVTDIDGAVRIGAGGLTPEFVAQVHALADRAERDQFAVLYLDGTAPAAVSAVDTPLVNKWERALRRLERLPATTVAVARGACSGVALEVLLATDYRIGTPDLRFALSTGAGGGPAWPGMALYRLANQLGPSRVRRAVLFGTPVDAATALDWSLLDEIAVDWDGARVAATAMAARSRVDAGVRRQLLLEATTATFEDALGRHLAACDRVLRREPA